MSINNPHKKGKESVPTESSDLEISKETRLFKICASWVRRKLSKMKKTPQFDDGNIRAIIRKRMKEYHQEPIDDSKMDVIVRHMIEQENRYHQERIDDRKLGAVIRKRREEERNWYDIPRDVGMRYKERIIDFVSQKQNIPIEKLSLEKNGCMIADNKNLKSRKYLFIVTTMIRKKIFIKELKKIFVMGEMKNKGGDEWDLEDVIIERIF